MQEIPPGSTVGDIVTDDYRTAQILTKYGV